MKIRSSLIFLFLVLFMTACGSTKPPLEPIVTPPAISVQITKVPIKAVYLVRDVGQLSPDDLQLHPEVTVTDDFEKLKEIAQTKVSIWIDINAVDVVDLNWLSQSPQAFYPVVLVGNGDEACSFFKTIHYFTFEVPCCLECSSSPPGYSVNIQTDISQGYMQGYETTPIVQDILDITNPLLNEVK